MTSWFTVPAIPFALSPSSGSSWRIEAEKVHILAHPLSDIFVDPGRSNEVNSGSSLNAVMLTGTPPAGDFQFSARVAVDFRSQFDAGALVVWVDDTNWAKLCFEYSPSGEKMVVSVVNRGVSDDANAFALSGRSVWLRVCRLDNVLTFHASTDGRSWSLVRVFDLAKRTLSAVVGFEAQSPTGDGCNVTFDYISFTTTRLSNLRDGS